MARLGGSEGLLASFLLVTTLILLVNVSFAEEILLTVNVKKALAMTSEKFLSYTLDPTAILTGDALTKTSKRSINMARALSPAYVRIGGPRSNSYTFGTPYQSENNEDTNLTITETNWIDVHRWAENAGLDLLVCIAPQYTEIGGGDSVWDSRNALDLISFSDRMGFNTSWQLGYECQTRCNMTGIENGKAVTRLRNMLDAFPRYAGSIVTGPDVIAFQTRQQQQYIQDYLNFAGNSLSAITWHPNFSGVSLDAESVSMHHDDLAIDRDNFYKFIGRSTWKRPLWLAESKPEDCKKQFLGALVWTRRLGNAAKLGVQVIMRQPDSFDLLQPTPDYWVSVLHKSLVGHAVLDTRIINGNRSHVNFYCQCTRPSSKYEKGSLTIFGINLTPSEVSVHLRGLKNKTTHKYILMPGYDSENRMFSETVLLNNEPLNLVNDGELPEIRPAVSSNSKGVVLKLPSGGIGFWVLPGLKIKSCGGSEDDNADRTLSKKLSKRLNLSESVDDDAESEETKNETRRHTSKSLKNRKRSHNRNSDEDDVERHFGRLEAKLDVEKLEKLIRKRDNYESKSSLEEDDLDDFTSQELSDKLDDYKKQLERYKDRIERVESMARGRMIAITDSEEMISSAKVLEAMSLIAKIEKAMKLFEMSDDAIDLVSLNESVVKDAPPSLVASSNASNPDDMFFDKLLKSKKIKRTSVPERIEDQLRVIRQLLAEEKERRDNAEANGSIVNPDGIAASETISSEGNLSRRRRQSDKRFGIDPLGLRKEGTYRRLSRIAEDTRERRNRRKDKDDRKEIESLTLDWKTSVDSGENNFYGFHKSEPMKNFPEGDVHLTVGNSEEETRFDNAHVKNANDDEVRKIKRLTKSSRRNGRAMVKPGKDDDKWIEAQDKQSSHVPKEFSENVRMKDAPCVRKDLKEYSELGEAESISQNHGNPFNAEMDEVATVKKIVPERHHDDQEDRRAKESTIEKLIGYYRDPSALMDEMMEHESTEDLTTTKSHATSSTGPSTINDAQNSKIGQTLFHLMNPAIKKKHVKDLASGESTSFTNFESMHFGKSTVSSVEEQAFSNYNGDRKVIDNSAKRTKRSTKRVLENVLDREMIFQDDNNLKDCDCRVTRRVRIPNNLGATRTAKLRSTRLRKPSPRQSVSELREARRNRKLERTQTPKPVEALDGMNSQTLKRPKRDAEVLDESVVEFVSTVPGLIFSDKRNEDSSTTEETVLQEFLDATTNSKIPSFQEFSGPDSNYFVKTDVEDISSREKEDNGATKSLTLDEEMINATIETEASGTSLVKRHDKEAMSHNEGAHIGDPESEVTRKSSKTDDSRLDSTKGSNIQFFRSRKNKKEITRKLNQAKEAEQTDRYDTTILPSVESTETTSIKSNRLLVPRATVKIATTAASPSVIPNEVAEEAAAKNEEATGDTSKTSLNNKKVRRKTSTMTSKAAPTISEKVKASRSTKNDATTLRRKSPKTQMTAKPSDPVKSRGNQKTTPSPGVVASKRNDERKARKSKRTEQLERLQEKLRQKREKLMSDYRDELLSDLEMTSHERKNLHQRETMTMNEKEIDDMIDTDKYEYIKRNKPIDYETMENPKNFKDSGAIGKKYIPKKVEIARPPHVTRERRVKPRKEISRATRASKSFKSSEEESNNERMMERLENDTTDHKIERRYGKPYYSLVGSVEDPRTLEILSYDEDFDEGMSLESHDVELDEALLDTSFAHGDEKITDYHQDSEDHILDWNDEEMVRPKRPEHFGSFLKNFDHDDHVLPKESSEDSSIERSEELLEFVNEDDHSNFPSMDDRTFNERKHEKNGRRLTKSKHDRLAMNLDESSEDHRSFSSFESDETFNEHESKLMRKKKVKNDVVNDSWIAKRRRESSSTKDSAVIDYADLDEMLNSGNYELLMLVPVNRHQKKNRQRRHVGNEITRDEGNSIGNGIRIEMMPKRINDKVKKANDISIFQITNKQNDSQISESSSSKIVEEPKTLVKNDENELKEYVIEKEFRSIPKVFFDQHEERDNDGGLSDLIERSVPKLEATVTGSLNKVRAISESFEKFIDDFNDRSDQEQSELPIDRDSLKHNEENNVFDSAFTSIKKFFDFLSGLVDIFRND